MADKKAEFTVPEGFSYVRETTKAGGVEYPIEYLQADTLDAWRNYWSARGLDVDATILKNLNEIQSQRASQSGKTAVRDAENDADREAAIAKHQKNARTTLVGAPRTRNVAGVTKKAAGEFGQAMVAKMVAKGGLLSDTEIAELAREYNVDPALLNK